MLTNWKEKDKPTEKWIKDMDKQFSEIQTQMAPNTWNNV